MPVPATDAGPTVSVLLPYRDAEATLGACLDSIADQSLDAWELVAVDDHSQDGSADLVARRADADSRIRPMSNPGRGLVDALNAGLAAARSDLVARMDADDLMDPRRLALQTEALIADPELAVLGTRVRLFPEHLVQAGYREYVRWQNACLTPRDMADEMFVESPLAHPSVCFRRSVVVAAGGYLDGDFPEDYELWLRLRSLGLRIAKLPEVLVHWREGDGRLSRVDPRYAREAFDAVRARYLADDLAGRLDGRDLAIWGAGRKTRRRCRHLLARGYAPVAWVDIDPRKIGNRLGGVPVVDPDWLDRRPRPFVLCYVTNHGARDDIAGALGDLGYGRGRDYLMVG